MHVAGPPGRKRGVSPEPENAVMLMRAVRTRKHSQSFGMVAQPKSQAVPIKLEGPHIVGRVEHHVIQSLRSRTSTPFAVLIQPLDVTGSIDRIWCRNDRTLVPHAQSKRYSVVTDGICSTICVAAHISVPREAGHQFLQAPFRVYTPYDQLRTVAFKPFRGSAVVTRPHDHPRAAGQLEYTFMNRARHWCESEIVPET